MMLPPCIPQLELCSKAYKGFSFAIKPNNGHYSKHIGFSSIRPKDTSQKKFISLFFVAKCISQSNLAFSVACGIMVYSLLCGL